jgi:YesN/AraC family two-component response regulator
MAKEEQQIIGLAVDYILQQYMRPLTLDELARQAHLSPAYFSCLFSRKKRQTFTEFLTSTRLNKAKELLASGTKSPISDIARWVGYEDANYFSQVFKKNVGMSPTSYRKRITMTI